MPFKVMYRNNRFVQGECQSIGKAGAGQKCTAQTRSLSVGNSVDITVCFICLLQTGLSKRCQPADVIAAGQFRHDTAIFCMHSNLCMQLMSQQTVRAVVQGDAGFITRRFYSQYQHVCVFEISAIKPVILPVLHAFVTKLSV